MKKRNYGIDLLRIVSMLMVIALHILGAGGVRKNTELLSTKYLVACFLETAAYCCVNCYALISGYVGIDSGYKHKNLLSIWLQTVFYTLGITILFGLIGIVELDAILVIKQFFPVYSKTYWYFTAYFAVYILMPAYNCIINHLSYKELKRILITGAIVFSVIPTIMQTDIFGLQAGYSFFWLSFMYVIGAFLRKYNIQKKMTILGWLCIYFASVSIGWGWKIFCEMIGKEFYAQMLIAYSSPVILLAGIALVMLFSIFEFHDRWNCMIGVLSASSFSVYLIHVHPLIWNNMVEGSCTWMAELSTLQMAGAVLAGSIVIYMVCWLIDIPRSFLFKKYINKRISKL